MSLNFNTENSIAFELLDMNGSETVRAAQSFAFDERAKICYATLDGAINRYELKGGVGLRSLDRSLINGTAVGHQGLAIEYLPTGIRLWTTSNVDRRAATRIEYQAGVAINTGEEYRLFPNTTHKNSIQTTPTVSLDNKWLVAQGMKADSTTTLVRVFNLATLVAGGPGNYTNAWTYEFEVPGLTDENNPMQGMACCGSYVYLVAGGTGVDATVNKRLHVYTIDGLMVEQENNLLIGKDKAMSVPNYRAWEPEGMSMRIGDDGKYYLYVGIMYAYPDRRYDIYRLNAHRPYPLPKVSIPMPDKHLGGSKSTLRYDLQAVNGSTITRGAQAFTFDERQRHLYISEAGAINRYPMDGGIKVNPIDQTLINGAAIGHQGLSTEYLASTIKLWTTSSVVGRSAARFSYTPGVAIDTAEVFELFPTGTFANSTSCTPTVSSDGKYLIAHGMRFGTTRSVVRVFDLATLVAGGAGNYTTRHLYEWETDDLYDPSNPLQGLASDGRYVYMVAGGTGFTPDVNKRFHIYDLITGEPVYKDNNLNAGRIAAAMEATAVRYEPEGLAIAIGQDGHPELLVGILSGDPSNRRFRMYQLNEDLPAYVPNRKTQMTSGLNTFAETVSKSITVPVNKMNTVLVTDADGKFDGRHIFMPCSIVENDTDLETQKGASETFESVFKWWKRISRGGSTYTDEFNLTELDTWAYDANTDSIRSTINSASVLGFVSPEKYEDYVFEVQVSSTGNDDDFAGVIAAYALDKSDNTTHILTVQRAGNGRAPLVIDKDFNGYNIARYPIDAVLDGLTWTNGTVATGPGVNGANGLWPAANPLGARIKVTRQKNILTVETSQFGSDVYFEPAKRVIDLAADPQLAVFLGPQSFGYTATSQPNATWKVFQRPESRLPIIDVRDWSKWVFANNAWTKVASTKANLIAEGLLALEWTHHNMTTGKFYYVDSESRVYRL